MTAPERLSLPELPFASSSPRGHRSMDHDPNPGFWKGLTDHSALVPAPWPVTRYRRPATSVRNLPTSPFGVHCLPDPSTQHAPYRPG